MNYIIDPKLVYWISVADGIKNLIKFIVIPVLLICVILLVAYAIDYVHYEFDEDKVIIKIVLRIIIVSISFFFISLFIPSKRTATEMIIASKVTTESIQATKEEIYNVIDYTVEKINSTER